MKGATVIKLEAKFLPLGHKRPSVGCFTLGRGISNRCIVVRAKFYSNHIIRWKFYTQTDDCGNFTIVFPPRVHTVLLKILIHDIVVIEKFGRCEQGIASYDGSANNITHPGLGVAKMPLLRRSKIGYANGLNSLAIRGTSVEKNPNPRKISNEICASTGNHPNLHGLTDYMWMFGQILDHDLDLSKDNSGIHAPVQTPPDDPYPGRTIDFIRSAFRPDANGVWQQMNDISAYVDGSCFYGDESTRAYAIRALDGSGKMNMNQSDNHESIPPYNVNGLPNADPFKRPPDQLFLAGDFRCNENVVLTSMHTLFLREHNRICDHILEKSPELQGQDEIIYQKARQQVVAQYQNIVYNEFLPVLLGDNGLDEYQGYDDEIDTRIANEFSTVAYRIGHTMLSPNLHLGDGSQSLPLKDAFFRPSYIQENGVNQFLQGGQTHRMQEIDNEVIDAVRDFLFGPPTTGHLLDLATLNIQRGRDHGLPGYNDIREAYGMPRFNSFDQITSKPVLQAKLASLYESPDYVDPWVGMLCEDHLHGSAVGPMCATILKDQFRRLRDGDRFYFENNSNFTGEEIHRFRHTRLSDILRRNVPGEFRDDVFRLH